MPKRTFSKRALVTALFIASVACALGQQPTTAVTADGQTMLLYPDGTWRLSRVSGGDAQRARTYHKPPQANLFIKAPKGPFGVWIDSRKWKRNDLSDDPSNKIGLTHTKGDAYAMIIAERIPVPMNRIKGAVVAFAKHAGARDVQIVSEDRRVVNGTEVLCLKMKAKSEGIDFIYLGYFYGGSGGTLQVMTFTSPNLFDEYRSDFEDLLNGVQIER